MQQTAASKKRIADDVSIPSRGDAGLDSQLFCRRCGERFDETEATDDGWYYRCPNEDCDGAGIHEDLYPVKDVLPSTTQ